MVITAPEENSVTTPSLSRHRCGREGVSQTNSVQRKRNGGGGSNEGIWSALNE